MILKKLGDIVTVAMCTVLVTALTAGPVLAECYQCDGPYTDGLGHQWMECWHPVTQGNVSCIPYVTTCSVGGACGGGGGGPKTFQAPAVAPDGSVVVELVGERSYDEGGIARNCLGLIVGRSYDEAILRQMRIASSVIQL
jgi:hypothetical protein